MAKRIVGAGGGGGGGGGCFLGHTLVSTPDGPRAIETLQPGDLVVSFDDQGQLHHAKVLKVHVHEGERVFRYRLWGGKVLDATPNHWVLNQFNAFVEIGSLGSDDCLVDENDHLRPIVERTEFCTGTVYNLTVEGHHTFIAGGVRVHNAGLGLGAIAGAGGGGGGGGKGGGGGGSSSTYTPTEAGDNLNSTQYATVVDLISEGEIQGLKDGLKSVYINNTPLQNNDNSYNFKNVTVEYRYGTQNQTEIPIAAAVEDERAVNVTVQNGTPVVRTVTETSVDAVRININVPQLQEFTDKGDIVGSSFRFQVQVSYAGGAYSTVIDDTISGRTGDAYQRDYLVDLGATRPASIRLVRVSADSASAKIINAFSWSSYTEITYSKLRYPNSAIVAMRIDAEQFNAIPSRSYLIRGIKVRIPSNATVDSTTGRLIYAGVWNGTFGAAQWCSDPAWVLFDLLTSKRYGFGDHIQASQLDKWAFYSASQYCSTLVPDGFGGQEPRFSCNVNIQTAEEAYKLINDLSSVMRVMPYWSTGSLTISQDKPADSTYLFTSANVTQEGFSYSSSSRKSRPTVAVVSYLDLTLRDMAYEVVEDTAAISKYGAITREISAFACTSRGQANRIGEWLLYSEQQEGEIVAFSASIDAGVACRPGQVIDIADPVKAGSRRGGRIHAATTTQITVDDASGIGSGNNRTLSVILPNGTVETRNVSGVSGGVVTVTSPFSTAPNPNSIWVFQSEDLQTTQWRVLTVQEQDDAKYTITALSYNPSKYDYIERDKPLEIRDTTNLNVIPSAPTRVIFTEALYEYQNQVRAKVIVSWPSVTGVPQYRVRWRKDGSNWTVLDVTNNQYEILDITPGLFEVEVFSMNAALKLSTTAATGSISALGKTAPPSNVSGFTYTVDPNIGVTLKWDPISDIDADQYEIRRGASWNTATVISKVKATTLKIGYLDDGSYTYLIKAIDTSGVYSTTAISQTITVTSPNRTTVTHVVQDPVVVLSWDRPALTTYDIAYYDIRYGNSWEFATPLTTTQSTSLSVPVTWTGSRTFWVAPVDLVGRYADPPNSRVVTITQASAPVITASVGGTTATLAWNAVNGTLATQTYEIRRGATYATASVLSSIRGTAYTLKADWSGNQTFWVVAVDANGNYGTPSSVVASVTGAAAPAITSTFAGRDVVLTWTAVAGTLDTESYVIKRGSTFATANTVATIKGTAYTLRVDWGGTQKFWVAAVDINGLVGSAASQDIVVGLPAQPTITQQVIDNNVLLRWNDVTATLPIETYEVRRGSTWAGATVIGTKQGGFTTVFETAAGTYTYWLAGIDSAGNYGTPGSVAAIVNQPPDYVLKFDQNSTFSGTKTNAILSEGSLYAGFDPTETWQSHFTSRSWTTPQNQIDAGFAHYLMPSIDGAYEEVFDYGAVLAGTKVSATLTSTQLGGTTIITPTISVRKLSTDPWTVYPGLSEVFVTEFQYFRVRYDFDGTGGDDLVRVDGLNVKLDSKLRNDAGTGYANAGDTTGTVINFSVDFVDVQSISVTPSGTGAVIAVYDFVDAPNPTSFKVLLFNTSGTRVSGNFSWTARGI